ncbi:MAG: T9SS type A sorting domain-containing protein [Lentimicrobiaceae bacterium]|nr:T9SS type A sorting domain-containing protein [Lentimicrobiaceae bacterium]
MIRKKIILTISCSHIRALAFSCIVLFCCMQTVSAQPVTLDPTFGENGTVIIPTTGISQFEFLDFDKQDNIIAVGRDGSCLLIAKTNTDGVMDQNFGIDGLVTLCDYAYTPVFGLKITHENKIFIMGSFRNNGYKIIFIQLNEDGSLDETFGDYGKIIASSISPHGYYPNLENDDFLLVEAGYAISKYNYRGEIDESFGENGKANLTDNETFKIVPVRIKILNDQSIIVAGYDELDPDERELAFCKISSTGDLVTDFANNGIWKMNIFNDMWHSFELFIDIAEESNGNLVLLGGFNQGNNTYVCSFYSDGTINNRFGKNGFYYIPPSFLGSETQKFLQHGSKYTIGLYNRIVSVKNDGTLDIDFNNTGLFICEYYFRDMKYQRADKLILVGDSYPNYQALRMTRLNVPSGVSVKENDAFDSFVIFPNPAKDYLYFNTERKFEIIDILGKTVLISEKAVQSVNISHLKAGIYFIKFEGKQARKFVKE